MAATSSVPTTNNIETQVAQAALAMVQPATDANTRRQASQFLEEWTKTSDAWEVYTKWISSFRHSHHHQQQQQPSNGDNSTTDSNNQIAMQMLCLTMLQSKIRKELRRDCFVSWHSSIASLRMELWEYLQFLSSSHLLHHHPASSISSLSSLLGPLCLCNAAIMVRSSDGMLSEFMKHLNNNNNNNNHTDHHMSLVGILPFEMKLRLLACIPSEMETCQDMTNGQITIELGKFVEIVLHTIQYGMMQQQHQQQQHSSPSTLLPACQALKSWTEIAHISLSQLNTPTLGGPNASLPVLIQFLSSTYFDSNAHYDEMTIELVARALTDAIMVVSDHCSSSRAVAAGLLWTSMSTATGFIVKPYKIATENEWRDACHALATLLATFVMEQIDDIVGQPMNDHIGIQLLLDMQNHPHIPVALIPLECWLTIQEIPMADRHEHWKKPLYRQVVTTLISRIAYPESFTTWEEEYDLDSSEFDELRRMVTDVFVSSYFLLRVEMIHLLIHHVRSSTNWTMSEAALFALTQISKDVCARCKSPAADGTMVATDRQTTCQALLQLLEQLISVNIQTTQSQHPLLVGAVVIFCGSYSPAWNSMDCPPQAILHLLAYLQSSFGVLPMEAAKATRAIYVSCLAKNMPNIEDLQVEINKDHSGSPVPASILPMVLKSVRDSMEAVLQTTEEEAMMTVAEGATRLVTKVKKPDVARQSLANDLINPVLHRISAALQALPDNTDTNSWMTPEVQAATETLTRCLSVIQVIARFCDSPHIPSIGEWFLQHIGSCLDSVQQRTASTPAQTMILPKWVMIHQQIIRNTLPQQDTIVAVFSNTIPTVVQALEQTRDPATLKYISTAVESFGGKSVEMDQSFQDLLGHVTTIVTRQSNLREATEFLQSYFDCLQRFILYCPRALCYNPQLTTIVQLAVECVTAIQAKESTRAALTFLSQLFGWNSLRLSPQTVQIFQETWNTSLVLQELLLKSGPILTQMCFTGLAGGSQMLWPAYSDCLLAIVQAVVFKPSEDHLNPANTTAHPSILNESLLQQWLHSGMALALTTDNGGSDPNTSNTMINTGTFNQVISILLNLAQQGPKSRSKAKMLLSDFAKIKKGEMTVDSLVSYALP